MPDEPTKEQVEKQNAALGFLQEGQWMLALLGERKATYSPRAKRLARSLQDFINDISVIPPDEFYGR